MYAVAKGIRLDGVKGCFVPRDVSVCLVAIRRAVCVVVLRVPGNLVVHPESALGLVDCSYGFNVVTELYLILLLCDRVEMVDAEDSGSVVASLNQLAKQIREIQGFYCYDCVASKCIALPWLIADNKVCEGNSLNLAGMFCVVVLVEWF